MEKSGNTKDAVEVLNKFDNNVETKVAILSKVSVTRGSTTPVKDIVTFIKAKHREKKKEVDVSATGFTKVSQDDSVPTLDSSMEESITATSTTTTRPASENKVDVQSKIQGKIFWNWDN